MVSFSLGIYFPFCVSGVCLFSKVVSPLIHTTCKIPHDKEILPIKKRK